MNVLISKDFWNFDDSNNLEYNKLYSKFKLIVKFPWVNFMHGILNIMCSNTNTYTAVYKHWSMRHCLIKLKVIKIVKMIVKIGTKIIIIMIKLHYKK